MIITNPPILTLKVYKNEYFSATHVSNGVVSLAYACNVYYNTDKKVKEAVTSVPIKLKCLNPEQATLRIVVKEISGTKSVVSLPGEASNKLLNILQKGRPEPGFNCVDLVTYLFNKYVKLNCINYSDWVAGPYQGDQNLHLGQVVCLHSGTDDTVYKDEEFKHMAIYIGSETYLSLLGGIGPIAFSSMNEMKKLYVAKFVAVFYPKL